MHDGSGAKVGFLDTISSSAGLLMFLGCGLMAGAFYFLSVLRIFSEYFITCCILPSILMIIASAYFLAEKSQLRGTHADLSLRLAYLGKLENPPNLYSARGLLSTAEYNLAKGYSPTAKGFLKDGSEQITEMEQAVAKRHREQYREKLALVEKMESTGLSLDTGEARGVLEKVHRAMEQRDMLSGEKLLVSAQAQIDSLVARGIRKMERQYDELLKQKELLEGLSQPPQLYNIDEMLAKLKYSIQCSDLGDANVWARRAENLLTNSFNELNLTKRNNLHRYRAQLANVQTLPFGINTQKINGLLANVETAISNGDFVLVEELERGLDGEFSTTQDYISSSENRMEKLNESLASLSAKMKELADWYAADHLKAEGLDRSVFDSDECRSERNKIYHSLGVVLTDIEAVKKQLESYQLDQAAGTLSRATAEYQKLHERRMKWEMIFSSTRAAREELKKAAEWALVDVAKHERAVKEIFVPLARFDVGTADKMMTQVEYDLANLGSTHAPRLAVSAPSGEYQKETFEEMRLVVQNTGTALAKNVTLTVDGPADFSVQDGNKATIPLLGPGKGQDLVFHLAFLRDGKVPLKITATALDHAEKPLPPVTQFFSFLVVKERRGAGPSTAAGPKGDVQINAKPDLRNGFLIYKMAVLNRTGLGLADTQVLLSYKKEILSFHHMSPPTLQKRFTYLVGEGGREDILVMGYLDPLKDQEVTVELYYHPYICTETIIEAELRFKDIKGARNSVLCEAKKFACYCPTFESIDTPNPAMVLSYFESAPVKDTRVEPISSGIDLQTAFEILRSTLMKHKLVQVGIERSRKAPYHSEAIFYGEEDLPDGSRQRYSLICLVSEKEGLEGGEGLVGLAELHIGCGGRTRCTALLATIAEQFNEALEKQMNVKRPIYYDMRQTHTIIKDSIIYKSFLESPKCPSPDLQVADSVVSKGVVAAAAVPALPSSPDPKLQKAIGKYTDAYHRAKFNDGVIDEDERHFLNELIEAYSLPPELVRMIERKVDDDYASLKDLPPLPKKF